MDNIKQYIDEVGATPDYDFEFEDRDVGLYIVNDWALLDEIGVSWLCGTHCQKEGDLNFFISVYHEKIVTIRKDIFLNLTDFANQEGESLQFSADGIECLKSVLEIELR